MLKSLCLGACTPKEGCLQHRAKDRGQLLKDVLWSLLKLLHLQVGMGHKLVAAVLLLHHLQGAHLVAERGLADDICSMQHMSAHQLDDLAQPTSFAATCRKPAGVLSWNSLGSSTAS